MVDVSTGELHAGFLQNHVLSYLHCVPFSPVPLQAMISPMFLLPPISPASTSQSQSPMHSAVSHNPWFSTPHAYPVVVQGCLISIWLSCAPVPRCRIGWWIS